MTVSDSANYQGDNQITHGSRIGGSAEIDCIAARYDGVRK
jgi:hypothetical protein